MALKPYALVSLAELKEFLPAQGTLKDAALEAAINRASLIIEAYLDRRIVYRAPAEVDGAANIVASRTLTDETVPGGSITQPNSAGRTLIVTLTDADRSVTAGTVTVTGTVAGVAGTTEAFDLSLGAPLYGVKFFTAISSVVVSGCAGQGAGDAYRVGSSLGYVEYHTVNPPSCELVALERPFRQVLEVNEDWSRLYATGTKLVENTDYELSGPRGIIRRTYPGKTLRSWYTWFRAVKVVYTAGFFTLANVPPDIKYEAMRLAALLFKETADGRLGVSSMSDAAQNITRFSPAMLTRESRDALTPHIRPEQFGRTGQRDFDLEAA